MAETREDALRNLCDMQAEILRGFANRIAAQSDLLSKRAEKSRKPLAPADTDARRLAYAVLEGDDDAALALADEVAMQLTKGPKFVTRDELVAALAPFAKYAEDVDRGETIPPPDDTHVGHFWRPPAIIPMKDCRHARDVVARHEEMMR